ncbi:rRNA pseudouridine synthase [Leptospira langatensis]|uniref:Pseudouridine synthase n=1 Tax=Leptospira langatensis TaxID=2484983 RepID=A0A5F1ZR27_9LEPT|nr:pseudouridine synthase [Leptospira langatensis]TGK05591.1 rRNA pseudouridine synthase [Leptospira langatensis]TGL38723.1 rRNA pseudouridine synthase [Leptospira langatensis]
MERKNGENGSGIRINRYLADCGFGSRRKTEELILSGKVKVNGVVETSLSVRISSQDRVMVGNKQAIPPEKNVFLALNKPKGYLCSHGDKFHSNTIFELLPSKFKQLAIAGRLDLDSRGLLLLSDDGSLIQEITHPSEGSEKEYSVSLDSEIPFEKVRERFLKGFMDEGEFLKAEKVFSQDRKQESDSFRVVLKQGRKRQIRRMFAALGARVTDLQRIRIGKLTLEKLNIGEGKFVLLDPKAWRP